MPGFLRQNLKSTRREAQLSGKILQGICKVEAGSTRSGTPRHVPCAILSHPIVPAAINAPRLPELLTMAVIVRLA